MPRSGSNLRGVVALTLAFLLPTGCISSGAGDSGEAGPTAPSATGPASTERPEAPGLWGEGTIPVRLRSEPAPCGLLPVASLAELSEPDATTVPVTSPAMIDEAELVTDAPLHARGQRRVDGWMWVGDGLVRVDAATGEPTAVLRAAEHCRIAGFAGAQDELGVTFCDSERQEAGEIAPEVTLLNDEERCHVTQVDVDSGAPMHAWSIGSARVVALRDGWLVLDGHARQHLVARANAETGTGDLRFDDPRYTCTSFDPTELLIAVDGTAALLGACGSPSPEPDPYQNAFFDAPTGTRLTAPRPTNVDWSTASVCDGQTWFTRTSAADDGTLRALALDARTLEERRPPVVVDVADLGASLGFGHLRAIASAGCTGTVWVEGAAPLDHSSFTWRSVIMGLDADTGEVLGSWTVDRGPANPREADPLAEAWLNGALVDDAGLWYTDHDGLRRVSITR